MAELKNESISLKVENLEVFYNAVRVLKGINLNIEKGCLTSILGPNGAGKTTLLRAISRIIDFFGKITVSEKDIKKLSRREISRLISLVPQDFPQDVEFTAFEVVLMGRYPYTTIFKPFGKEDYKAVIDAMKTTNTLYLKERKFSRMSSGERQRIIIAKALAQETSIMLLDEPTSNLDISHSIKIMRILRRLADKGMIIISSMHNINLASLYSDRIVLLKNGKIFAEGKPEDVITQENIKAVYGIDVLVEKHRITGKPQIAFIP